ncbi:MAG: response regulator transcription factor [Tepidisphaeraceae bacterium]|jgi:DNA-binding NarL/FixJ family response regulator
MTRVLIVDDHDIVRQGLRGLVEKEHDMQVVGEAADGRTAVRMAAELCPEIAIVDITMPQLNGIEATRQIRACSEGTRVLILSMHSGHRFVAEALKAGASGYLLKEAVVGELVSAIRSVAKGRVYLSPQVSDAVVDDYVRHVPTSADAAFGLLTAREREVLQLIAEGRTTKEAAQLLRISVKTVETHRAQIMAKLRIHSVAGLTKYAIHEGLTSPEI